MTPPIQEPSTPRSISGLAWGISQLARRPAPSGACPCPVDWMVVFGPEEEVSIPNDTRTAIAWDQYAVPPNSQAFNLNSVTNPIRCLLRGWYMVFLQVEWAGAGFADVRQYRITGNWDNIDTTYQPRTAVSDPYESGCTVTFGPLHVKQIGNSFGATVWQKSGTAKVLSDFNWMTAVYMGPGLDIDDGVTDLHDLLQVI